MVSSPLREILLLSFSSPRRGIPLISGTRSAREDDPFWRSRFVAWWFLDITCIKIVNFNICLYKTKVLSTIELLGDNWRIVMIIDFMSIGLWAQEAFLLMLGLYCIYWTTWDRYMQVPYLGRAPRTKETLPRFSEVVSDNPSPLVFRGLTGSQRTPGFWGVTYIYVKISFFFLGKL